MRGRFRPAGAAGGVLPSGPLTRPLVTAADLARGEPLPEGALLTPLARDLLRRQGRQAPGPGQATPRAARLLIANWKCWKTAGEAREFARELRGLVARGAPGLLPIVCPPFTALHALHEALGGAAELGAQDISAEDEGAYTGEVAARHLVDAGCRWALVGHSERRHMGEDEPLLARKLRAALRGGLRPVLCVGETAEERRGRREQAVVREQLRAALDGLEPARLARVALAYEPRWAIGAGVTPTPAEVEAMLAVVREGLAALGGPEVGQGASVLYGGSVSGKNAAELLRVPGCSGALVGGASLSAAEFARILAAG